MRKTAVAAAALCIGAVLPVVVPGTAGADVKYLDRVQAWTSENILGKITTIKVKDLRADGYGGRSYWSTNTGYSGIVSNSGGSGATVSSSLPNNSWVKYNACIKDGSATVACSGKVTDS